jgi:tetratricopeptide (TPR) repeat protein
MSMAPEQKPEIEKELGEIRREVIESRNLVIKTDNLLKNLHAEVKAVGKWQTDQQRKQWVSSGVVYALFAILAGTFAFALSSAKASGIKTERDTLQKQVADLSTQLDKQKSELSANALAQRSAGEVYKEMTELPGDERLKGIDAYAKLDTSRLSSLEKSALRDRADALRKEVGESTFERGKNAFHKNDMPGVVAALTRFQAMNPPADELQDSEFFLGVAYNSLKKHDLAVAQLGKFVSGDKRSKSRDYGMTLLAQSLEETGAYDKALAVAREGLATYPNSQFAGMLRHRIGSVNRSIALAKGVAPTLATPTTVAPAKAAAPAPSSVPAALPAH